MMIVRAHLLRVVARRKMRNGMGKIRRSVRRFVQLISSRTWPALTRPTHLKPPNVVGFHVLPVRGGHSKMRKHQGIRQVTMLNVMTARSVFLTIGTIDATLKSNMIIEALTKGRISGLRMFSASIT